MISSVCIFCGSRPGAETSYRTEAERLGHLLGRAGIEVVYGGGHVGLMGVVADAAMAAGGKVTGFIPDYLLQREVGHRDITELVVTDDMFDRKDRMIAHADAFVLLPGGLGTLDEFFEVLTLRQLGRHQKPILLIDVDGFWQPLEALVDQVVANGFAGEDVKAIYRRVKNADAALPALGIGDTEPLERAAS